jgi:hypothetical protein
MRKLLLLLLTILCVLLIVPIAQSQFLSAPVRTTIESDFMVGNIRLPAGEYLFSFDTARSRMYIRNEKTFETVSVGTMDIIDTSGPTGNKLVFVQDGKNVVLHRVWSEQAGHVHDIIHGSEVKELK